MTVNDLTDKQYSFYEDIGAFEYMQDFGFSFDDVLSDTPIPSDELIDEYFAEVDEFISEMDSDFDSD